MPAPNTGGVLRTRIQDMQVGDYIVWKSNGSAYIMDGDTTGYVERPVKGATDTQLPYAGTYWYGIKVDKGLIIADRMVQHSVSWDALNVKGIIEGRKITLLDGTRGLFRSLGGGNAYADVMGDKATSDQGQGAWPTNNEWDKYIVKGDYGNGAGRDDVWRWIDTDTWCQDTIGVWYQGVTTNRVRRGNTSVDRLMGGPSSTITTASGFRPVFEYSEVNS